MTAPVYNVLFLCTGNSARSIIAEALLRHLGAGKFRAFSAGSMPKGAVHPLALETLAAHDVAIDGLRSKSWLEFEGDGAPQMKFVFTVCDNAAGETCPLWPGQPMTAHWGIEDPAAVEGSDLEKRRAFNQAYRYMRNRIEAFAALPLASIEAIALRSRLGEIGAMAGSSTSQPKVR